MIDSISFPKQGKATVTTPYGSSGVASSSPVEENLPSLTTDSSFEGSSSPSPSPSAPPMAGSAGFRVPPSVAGFGKLKKLSAEALSDVEIQRQIQVEHGWTPGDGDLTYARKGMRAFFPRSDDPETQEIIRQMRVKEQDHQVKIHMVLAQILMGDIPGALRSYAILMDRDLRQFTRLVVEKLGQVSEARTRVIRNFAHQDPPPVYAGTDKTLKERSLERSDRYKQFAQLSTQLMNELQSTERELTDALKTQFRNIEQMWQQLSQLEEEKFRTDSRMIMR